eukprot:146034-Lingulodinium_polyedra.AAC.1
MSTAEVGDTNDLQSPEGAARDDLAAQESALIDAADQIQEAMEQLEKQAGEIARRAVEVDGHQGSDTRPSTVMA